MAPLSRQSDQANFMNGLGRGQDRDDTIEEQVRTDRLHQLFRQSFAAILGSYLAAAMLCWLCWDRLDQRIMLVWLVTLGVSSLLRIKMFMEWFRCPYSERTPERWERRYWITLVLSASIWGGGAFALIPTDDRLSQVLVMLFTVGIHQPGADAVHPLAIVAALVNASGDCYRGPGVFHLCVQRHAQIVRGPGEGLSPDPANGACPLHLYPRRTNR
jgi:hypothetical protein